jgi:hypothetical protein
VCTVLLRLRPGAEWPLLLAAVRDALLDRPWDPPDAHWPSAPDVQGGRDRTAGGTWLAIDRAAGVVAAVLNGVRLPARPRPSRGSLPLAALSEPEPVTVDNVQDYDGFHLLRADRESVEMWSWDGESLDHRRLPEGDHIVVNLGADRVEDPLVPHFLPMLAATPDPAPWPGLPAEQAWDAWITLLSGDGLAPTDPRGLLIEYDFDGIRYGSSSASLVGISAVGSTRYDFTPTPRTPNWVEITSPRHELMSD